MQAFRKTTRRGFTLIELLVVLGILSMLLTVAIAASLASRENADDRFIKGQFGLIRLEAEQSYRDQVRRFNLVCADAGELIAEMNSPDIACVDGNDGYALQVQLSTGEYYCMDTKGQPNVYAGNTIDDSANCNVLAAPTDDCTCGP